MMDTTEWRMLSLCVLVFLQLHHARVQSAVRCPYPAVPLYGQLELSDDDRQPGTVATYTCDPGYELFGSPLRKCRDDGKWDGDLPFCGVNIAYRKSTNQSSTVRGGDSRNGNDGRYFDNSQCTETKIENSPWWQVDLLRTYEVRVVRVFTRGCCGHAPLHDLEIRVGNSSVVQGNRLCAWYPGTLGDGISKDFICAYPIYGRYVYVNMVGVQGTLSLCEVMVYTTRELSWGRCGTGAKDASQLTTFNGACYQFQSERAGSFATASDYCIQNGGQLLYGMDTLVHQFVAAELEHRKDRLKSKLVWLGVRRDPGLRSRTWRWVSGQPAVNYMWADDQPNNYNGQQNCVVLDGGRKWMWNDVTCDLDYLPWVCQYAPSICGSPDREENSTVEGGNYNLGSVITYRCPNDHVVQGHPTRTCSADGFWSGSPPTCRYVDCGPVSPVENGKIILANGRTTFNSTVLYVCNQNYSLIGNDIRTCGNDSLWSGDEPECLLSWCTELPNPKNGSVVVSSLKAGSTARYSCKPGHKLIGSDVRTCEFGGTWKGREPSCMYIECGNPPPLVHGEYVLVNQSTTYLSQVVYSCNNNYSLVGDHHRICLDTGHWSGRQPICKLITCGKPGVSYGSRAEVDSYTIHSVVRYFCEPGHLISGPAIRFCGEDGVWTGHVPTCTYVDCSRVPPVLKGEVVYPNGTTYLHSTVRYTCSQGYRLQGEKLRHCLPNGRWSGAAPKCEEIRCATPMIPKNATAVYGGNDRSSWESFRVGSTVQYKCIPGHLVKGHPLRTCLAIGEWSGESPSCHYVDCGTPPPVSGGSWALTSNKTFYGSQVDYVCESHFILSGPERRLCLENGTWSGPEPVCAEIVCAPPETADDHTAVIGDSLHVGSTVIYSCVEGYVVVGGKNRTCLENGFWSGELPFCKAVDCGQPSVVANGRGFLVNGTTSYLSVVQYQCIDEFYMIGDSLRTCLSHGKWSGEEPQCVDLALLERENAIGGRLSESQTLDSEPDNSRMIVVSLAVSAGGLIVIILIVALVCVKTRSKKVKNTENVEVIQPEDKDTTVMSYSRLSIDSTVCDNPILDGVRNHPNGLTTFSPSSTYSSTVSTNGRNLNGHSRKYQVAGTTYSNS